MKITSNNRTVDLHPDNPKEILFSISGGTDSASLLYLIVIVPAPLDFVFKSKW